MKKLWLILLLYNSVLALDVCANPLTHNNDSYLTKKILLIPVFNWTKDNHYAYLTDYITNALKINLRNNIQIQVFTVPYQLLDPSYAPSRLAGNRENVKKRLGKIKNLNKIDKSNQINGCILAEYKVTEDALQLTIQLYDLENFSLAYNYKKSIGLGLDVLKELEVASVKMIKTLVGSRDLANKNKPNDTLHNQEPAYLAHMTTNLKKNNKTDTVYNEKQNDLLVSLPLPAASALNLNFGVAIDYKNFPGMEYRLELLKTNSGLANTTGPAIKENSESENPKKYPPELLACVVGSKDKNKFKIPHIPQYKQPFYPMQLPGGYVCKRKKSKEDTSPISINTKVTDFNSFDLNAESSFFSEQVFITFPLYLSFSLPLNTSSELKFKLNYDGWSLPFHNMLLKTYSGEVVIMDTRVIKDTFLTNPANLSFSINLCCSF